MRFQITSFEEIDAIISIVGTLVPIALALVGGAFGFQATRGSDRDLPPVTIIKLVQQTEDLRRIKRLRRYQFVELGFGILIVIRAAAYFTDQLIDVLVTDPPSPDTPGDVLIMNAAITLLIVLTCFYASLIWPYTRAMLMLWRTPYNVPSIARSSAEIVLDAPRNTIAQRCQHALGRMRSSLREVDLEAGVIKARRHYFFNLYRVYYDDLTVKLRHLGDDQYAVSITSDGIIPTLRSDKQRNIANLKRFTRYLID